MLHIPWGIRFILFSSFFVLIYILLSVELLNLIRIALEIVILGGV